MKISKSSLISLITLGFYSAWYALLYAYYVEGDPSVYRFTYEVLEINFFSSLRSYYLSLRAIDISHFLYVYFMSSIGLSHFMAMACINIILLHNLDRYLKQRGCKLLERHVFFLLNYYLIVIMVPAERLKFAILFLTLFLVNGRVYNLLLAFLSHIQAMMFLPLFVRVLFMPKAILLALVPVGVLFTMNYQWLFSIITQKYLYYISNAEPFDLIPFLVFFSVNLVSGFTRLHIFFHIFMIVLLLVFGGDRITIIYFFSMLFLMKDRFYKKGLFTSLNILLGTKSFVFILNIFMHGNGFSDA